MSKVPARIFQDRPSDDAVLESAGKALDLLARDFAFAYYDEDDIRQEGLMEAVRVVRAGKYDPSRCLDAFLYAHLRNRLHNLKRNKQRRKPPCSACADGSPCGPEGATCEPHRRWAERNDPKAYLSRPLRMDAVPENQTAYGTSILDDMVRRETLASAENLPPVLRSTYLRIRDGMVVADSDRAALAAALDPAFDGGERKGEA